MAPGARAASPRFPRRHRPRRRAARRRNPRASRASPRRGPPTRKHAPTEADWPGREGSAESPKPKAESLSYRKRNACCRSAIRSSGSSRPT
jgi:hypothetical protein